MPSLKARRTADSPQTPPSASECVWGGPGRGGCGGWHSRLSGHTAPPPQAQLCFKGRRGGGLLAHLFVPRFGCCWGSCAAGPGSGAVEHSMGDVRTFSGPRRGRGVGLGWGCGPFWWSRGQWDRGTTTLRAPGDLGSGSLRALVPERTTCCPPTAPLRAMDGVQEGYAGPGHPLTDP